MTLTEEALAEIEGRLTAASKTPWFVAGQPWDDRDTAIFSGKGPDPHGAELVTDCSVTMEWEDGDPDPEARDRANAEFIAHSRTDIPNLIAALREEREKLKAAVEALEQMKQDCEWYSDKGTHPERQHFVAVELVDAMANAMEKIRGMG